MKMRLAVFLYSIFLIFAVLYRHYILAGIIILSIPCVVAASKILMKKRVETFKKRIALARKNYDSDVKFLPFVNPNKHPYYILELIPGVSTPLAKAAQNRQKKKKFKGFVDFADFCHLDLATLGFVEKLLKF